MTATVFERLSVFKRWSNAKDPTPCTTLIMHHICIMNVDITMEITNCQMPVYKELAKETYPSPYINNLDKYHTDHRKKVLSNLLRRFIKNQDY